MTRVSRRHDAVEEVHAAVNAFEKVYGSTDAHQVARLVLRHIGFDRFDDAVHFFGFFTDGETADRVAGEVKFADLFHVAYAQVGIGAALVDAEEKLTGVDGIFELGETVEFFLAAAEPSCGAVAGIAGVVVFRRVFDAFVKRHRDGGAEVGLDAHAFFRSHENALAVDVGREVNAFFLDAAQTCEREDLESAAVGQSRLVPAGELLKTALVVNETVARTDVEVVGVREHDLAVDIHEVNGGYAALDRRAGCNVHENRGFDFAVGRDETSAACVAVFVGLYENEHGFVLLKFIDL